MSVYQLAAQRLSHVYRIVRNGQREHYPWCCVLRFAWDSLVGVKSGLVRGVTIKRARDGAQWVPCGRWHHNDPLDTAAGRKSLLRDTRIREYDRKVNQ